MCRCPFDEKSINKELTSILVYLTLRRPDRGEISFLKAGPIWAAANGSLPLLASKRRLKFTKIPCAVSGLR